MIKIEELYKIYKSKKKSKCEALKDINLNLPDKGLVFVLGKSGSGKSTLLNLIGGLDNITKGSIVVDGNDISKFNEGEYANYRNNHVGFIFQDYHLLNELTVYENISLSLDLNRINDDELVFQALEKVGLSGYNNRFPSELSGGERQRVAIARAIVKKPRIILADEPTGNLDNKTATSIIKLLKELSKECLIIVVSHNTIDSYAYADRIIELSYGEIISDKSRNVNYNDDIEFKDGIAYIPYDKVLNNNDVNLFNTNLNSLRKIVLNENKYSDSLDVKLDAEVKEISNKNLSILKEFKLSCKFLQNKIIRIVFYSLITAVLLTILAVGQTITSFKSGDLIKKELENAKQDSLVVRKTLTDEEKQFLEKDYVIASTDVELEKLKSSHSGKSYDLLNYSISASSTTQNAGWNEVQMTSSLTLTQTFGTLVVDDEFLNNKFNNLDLVVVAEEQKSYGVYITDYFADCMLQKHTIYKGKTYKDLLGVISYVGTEYTRSYINGIINTGYKEKYKTIIEKVNKSKFTLNSLFEDKDFQVFYNDVIDRLGYSYTTNSNFIEDFNDSNIQSILYHHKLTINGFEYIEDGSPNFIRAKIKGLDLKDNEVTMNLEKFNELFNTNYTTVNPNNFKEMTITVDVYRYYDVDCENKLESLELKIVGLHDVASTFIGSDDICERMEKIQTYAIGVYFYNLDNINYTINTIDELGYTFYSSQIYAVNTMAKAVTVFVPIFELIAGVLCAAIVFVLVNFGSKMIKDKIHEIGVLKAVGAKNKTIVVIFGLQILLIALCTFIIYVIGYASLIGVANDLLVTSLKTIAPSRVMMDLEFLTFKVEIMFIDLVLILVLSLIALIGPIVKIRKIKPVQIIKSRE